MRTVLNLVRRILREQEEGSDYDALYFGMQDVRDMLEDMQQFQRNMSPQQMRDPIFSAPQKKTRRSIGKRKQSPKQKLLTQMTKKKWDKYKKGSGKKTYLEIRAQVSRSQEFKKKSKRL